MNHQVLLAHPGTQHSHQLAKQLALHGCLYEFWTGFGLAKETWYARLLKSTLPLSLQKKVANRLIEGIPAKCIRLTPWIELKALRQLHKELSHEMVLHKRNQAFQERITATSIQNSSVLIGFDTSSWILAGRAHGANKPFVLDQSIAHPLAKEVTFHKIANRHPQWRDDLEIRSSQLLACEQQEHDQANKIVVASTYTKQTLVAHGVAQDKIVVNSYGVDIQRFHPTDTISINKPLRFLFLGAITARKGVPFLIQAWQSLRFLDAELWLVGPIKPSIRTLIPNMPGLIIKGKYPHEDLPELLRQCDVLVFPSYFEGFGLVLLEALASGLPIITTEATAGPDLITDEREGFLIPSGELDELCRVMQFFIDNPNKLGDMSLAARHCAEQYSWDAYGDRWQKILLGFN